MFIIFFHIGLEGVVEVCVVEGAEVVVEEVNGDTQETSMLSSVNTVVKLTYMYISVTSLHLL